MPPEYGSCQCGDLECDLGFSATLERRILHSMRRRGSRYCIPKRYLFSLLSFTACCLAVSFNINLSVAIVSMLGHADNSTLNDTRIGEVKGLDWSPDIESLALGAVYYGQLVSFIPGGRMAELYGGKRMLLACMGLASAATLLSPLAALWSPYVFVAVRVLVGLGTGPVIPVLFFMVSRWIPDGERSCHASFILSGYGIGSFLAVIVSGALCGSSFLEGWPSVFYTGGLSGILWCLLCAYVMCETPDQHPSMNDEEYLHIVSGLRTAKRTKILKVPWSEMALSVPLWALAIGFFGQFWLLGFFSTVHALYMGTVLDLPIVKNGLLSCLPHLLRAFATCMASYPVDVLLDRKIVGKGFVRKGATLINSVVSCGAFFGITLVGRDVWSTTLLFILGGVLGEFVTFGVCMACIDIAPDLSGTVSGIINIVGVFPFFIIPALVGWMTNYENSIEKWRQVFIVSIAVVLISTFIFIIFGDLNPQPWGVAKDAKKNPAQMVEASDSESDEKKTLIEKNVQDEDLYVY